MVKGTALGPNGKMIFSAGTLSHGKTLQITRGSSTIKVMDVQKNMKISDGVELVAWKEPHETFKLSLKNGITLLVEHINHAHLSFLNLDTRGVGSIKSEISGILGYDDH